MSRAKILVLVLVLTFVSVTRMNAQQGLQHVFLSQEGLSLDLVEKIGDSTFVAGSTASGEVFYGLHDGDLNWLWQRTLTGSAFTEPSDVVYTQGQIWMAVNSLEGADTVANILRIASSNGDILITYGYGNGDDTFVESVSSNGNDVWGVGTARVGITEEVIRFTIEGDSVTETKSLSSSLEMSGVDVLAIGNEQSLVGSFVEESNTNLGMTLLDENGTPVWSYSYDFGVDIDKSKTVDLLAYPDGYLIGAYSDLHLKMLYINTNGTVRWSKEVSSVGELQAGKSILTAKGVFFFGFHTSLEIAGYQQSFIGTMDKFGTMASLSVLGDSSSNQVIKDMAYNEDESVFEVVGSNDYLGDTTRGWMFTPYNNGTLECFSDIASFTVKDITSDIVRNNISGDLTVEESDGPTLQNGRFASSAYDIGRDSIVCEPPPAVPVPDIVAITVDSICRDEEFSLMVSGDTSYVWMELGGDTLSTDSIWDYSLEVNTTFLVSGAGGDIDTLLVYVKPVSACYTPKLYDFVSPNGDGDNDVLWIDFIEYFPNNTVMIFNKWGDEVFSATGYDNESISWGPGDLPNDVYTYVFEYFVDNEKVVVKGRLLVEK